MIILHQDDGVLGVNFAAHRIGELLIHSLILTPVLGSKQRSRVRDVTQRPQAFVRKAIVIALLLFLRQPYAADMVRLLSRRHADVVIAVHGFAIGIAAPMGDPYSGAGSHHRLQRRHQPARRMLDLNLPADGVLMDIRLPIRENHDFLAMQVAVESLLQAGRSPQSGSIFPVAGHAADQLAHVAQDGLKFPALLSSAAQQAAKLAAPVIARPLGYEHGHPDHDTAAVAVALACKKLGRNAPQRAEFAGYHLDQEEPVFGAFWNCGEEVAIHLSPEELRRKRAALQAYASQSETLAQFPISPERFRRAPDYHFTSPAPPQRALYDLYGWQITGSEWRARLAELLA